MNKQYYGPQTKLALDNFKFSYYKIDLDFIYAITEIKKASAMAHAASGGLHNKEAQAIISACDEILSGKFDDQFVTTAIQGGAGTSTNMNVNEVIAARATELLKNTTIHPNDHVNKSESTNDVNPSALKIVCIRLTRKFLKTADVLTDAFDKKAREFANIQKLGRTHYQDAVPITLGDEFASYSVILKRDKRKIEDALRYMYDLNLGGTAVGNSINASDKYIKVLYKRLPEVTGLPLKKSSNLMSLTSGQTDFYFLSSALTAFCLSLSKISTDLRFLSSGPRGGIGEIILEPLQPGSSIMPGKINPILPESMNEIYYFVSGKNLTVEHAVEGAHLELGVMMPVIADSLISSLKLVESAVKIFAKKCIATIKANKKYCARNLEESTAYATLLVPKLGYDTVSSIVKEAVAKGKTIREVALGRKLLTEKEFNLLVLIKR